MLPTWMYPLIALACVPVVAVVAARLVRVWQDRHEGDPMLEELERQGKFNSHYSVHAPVGCYDQDKAVAAAARARTSDRQQMRTAAARAVAPQPVAVEHIRRRAQS